MIGITKSVFKKVFGTRNDREIKKLQGLVGQINEIESSYQSLSDDALRQKTAEWKAKLSQIEDDDELAQELEAILPEVFAAVKNACRRLCGRHVSVKGHDLLWEMIPFDVQLIGGYALHSGRIAEMATGEGKTLVATLPVYLNALTGRSVHIVTVNDYLASRDSEWMGAVYKFLGLTVGCIVHDQAPQLRREQYNCDVTYGTNSEFGFDYLRDNGMASKKEEQVQRQHYFAIVDEVDSILIDEARTPLIISGPAVVNTDNRYDKLKPAIEGLVRRQKKLCQDYLKEAEVISKKLRPEDDSNPENPDLLKQELGLLLYRTKLGAPKSPGLLRFLENPENLKLMTKAELTLHADQTKKELYAQKEALFFAIEEKSHDADLTEKGRGFLSPKDPNAFMLPDLTETYHEIDSNNSLDAKQRIEAKSTAQKEFEAKAQQIHTISQLLKAYCLYEKDVQYVVQNNEVVIVDENTGRLMTGRRWSEGLHQAVEAKEGVEIKRETQTYATITIQNYFRLYTKLAGMTGTAETEASEFLDIYKLGVLVIPTNRPVARKDAHDTVYKTRREKYNAVIDEIREINGKGRPILVGTISVEVSEYLSKLLKKERIVHSVLNAKYHEQEAEIVARAGNKDAVTIATNMAGRGTDIKLADGVNELGGLHVIGTERHEARRIDRQLRGRCARQGDNGSSHFFISLEDDLMRLFGSDRISKVMEKVGLEEGQELEHPLLNRSIETAQKRVEQHNFQIRKRTLEYDDVMNKQREIIYGFRNEIIRSDDVQDRLMDVMEDVVVAKVEEFSSPDIEPNEWNVRALTDWTNLNFPLSVPEDEIIKAANAGTEDAVPGSIFEGMSPAQIATAIFISDSVRNAYKLKISVESKDALQSIERFTILSAIDKLWQEHLYSMDGLRSSIGLRAYGQRDPLIEYKTEAFKIFDELMVNIKSEICHNIFRSASSLMAFQSFLSKLPQRTVHQGANAFGNNSGQTSQQQASNIVSEANEAVSKTRATSVRTGPKVGRNDPCPCGSSKKYKQCCGKA
ncbi:MAG: Protein translocase subunit SecA [Verrucomicrobia subdivision 3 bacterium]|nr:Protein translocase subunit SecA [Limisphaerales bacterium]MCS1416383.1 Protein translocase subunit SecA [Limisphaerales bacterium]